MSEDPQGLIETDESGTTQTHSTEVVRMPALLWLIGAALAVSAAFGVVICIPGLMLIAWHRHDALKEILRYSNSMATWFERKGAFAIIAYTLFGLLIPAPVYIMGIIFFYTTVFKNVERTFRWLYSTVTFLGVMLLFGISTVGISILPITQSFTGRLFPGFVFRDFMISHATFYRVSFQVYAVFFLAMAATGIYIFKQKALTTFGITEIAIALISNTTLLGEINLSSFPKFSLPPGSWLPLVGFTYLLSRGIGDTIDGINKLKAKHEDLIITWFAKQMGQSKAWFDQLDS